MTRTHAARRLLEHGPLSFAEMVEITGWRFRQVQRVLEWLLECQEISRTTRGRCGRYVYALTSMEA